MEEKPKDKYEIKCYDIYGHCTTYLKIDFEEAIKETLEQFKNVKYQIVRMVSPYQDNEILYMSKVGY